MMCRACWKMEGSPDEIPPDFDKLIDLIDDLYKIHPAGGPLHTALDDWNLDGQIEPDFRCWPDEVLDELWFDGLPLSELDSDAPAVIESLGRSTRALCVEIASLLNEMTEPQRYAALAGWHGFLKRS